MFKGKGLLELSEREGHNHLHAQGGVWGDMIMLLQLQSKAG